MTGPIAQTGKPRAAYRIGRDLGMTADMALHLQASDGNSCAGRSPGLGLSIALTTSRASWPSTLLATMK